VAELEPSPSRRDVPPILCDEATRAAANTRIVFEALEPIALKGVAEPVPVFRARANRRKEDQSEAVVVVGREPETRILDALLSRIHDGEPAGVVTVEGDAGLGKSVLVAAAVEKARDAGIRVLMGSATGIERATPYYVFRRVFGALLGTDVGADSQTGQGLLEDIMEPWPELAPLAPLLNPVLGLNTPDTPLSAELEGEVRADNTRRVLVTLLESYARKEPTLLALEDAHWFDSASWALLRELTAVTSFGVLVSTRPLPEDAEKDAASMRNAEHSTWMTLGALSESGTRTLIANQLGVALVPDEIARWVHERGAGNPFFVGQIVAAMTERSAIEIADDTCRLSRGTQLSTFDMPDTLEGVVTARLDRLNAADQLTVKVASVIGRSFELSTLLDVHPVEGSDALIRPCLSTLEKLDIARREKRELTTYFFRHVILHEVAYNLLLGGQRRELHASVADWYEGRFAEDLSPHHGLLAWHLERAVLPARALRHLERAGELALRQHANREAIGFLERAGELATSSELKSTSDVPTDLMRGQWEREIGDAYYALGQLPDATKHLERAAAILGRPRPGNVVVLVVMLVVATMVQLAHRAAPHMFEAPGSERARRRLELARAYIRLGEIAYFHSDFVFLSLAILHGVNLAKTSGPCPELVRAFSMLSVTAAAVPVSWLSRYYSKRATDIGGRLEESGALAFALTLKALNLYGLGQTKVPRAALEEAVQIAERLGDMRRYEESRALLAHVELLEGDFVSARDAFAKVFELAHRRDDVQPQIWGLVGRFVSALHLGRSGLTAEGPERACEIVKERNAVLGDGIYAAGVAALARRVCGDLDGARSKAEEGLELLRSTMPTSVYALEGYCGVTETLVSLYVESASSPADRDEALRVLAHAACRGLSRFAYPFSVAGPRAALFRARYQFAIGRPVAARRLARKSLARAEKLSLGYDCARAHALLANLHEDDAEQARHHTDEVSNICEKLSASADWAWLNARLGPEPDQAR